MSAVERALLIALPWLVGGLVVAPLGLLLGPAGSDPMARLLIHLAILVVFGLLIADRLIALLSGPWFAGTEWSETTRHLAGAIVLVIIPTGIVGLVTLASAAALRFDPSLQFLQLLSALDIVWGAVAVLYGMYLVEDRSMAHGSALIFLGACVGSLWLYLSVVGFTPAGGWVVDARELIRYVLPADAAAAVVAVTFLVVGVRRSVAGGVGHPMEQDSDQS